MIVLKQAKLIMADETVTQKVVDEGVENLQNAIDSLIKLSDSQTSDESFKPGDSVDTSDNLDYRTAGLLMLLCGIIITATRRKKQDI